MTHARSEKHTWLSAQNTTRAQVQFGAADAYWQRVQWLRTLQLVVVVALPALLAVAAQFTVSWTVVAGFVAFSVTILDAAFYHPYLAAAQRKAAQAQDAFDSTSFALQRSPYRAEQDEDPSDIRLAAARQSAERSKRNADWYSPVLGELPVRIGRLACMRESLAWDGGLREHYVTLLRIIFWALIGLLISYSLYSGLSAADVLLRLVFPLTSVFVWLGREISDNASSISDGSSIREALIRTLNAAVQSEVSDERLDILAADFSAALCTYRAGTPPVPDLLYLRRRLAQATAANAAATDIVSQYNAIRSKRRKLHGKDSSQ